MKQAKFQKESKKKTDTNEEMPFGGKNPEVGQF